MNSKSVPWLVAAILLLAAAGLYMVNRKHAAELEQLRADNAQLQQLKASDEEAKKNQAQSDNEELVRLRKENEDILRLRNEVRQLRDEKAQLGKDVQTAQSQAINAQAQVQNAQAQTAALRDSAAQAAAMAATNRATINPTTGLPMTPDQEAAFRARYGLAPGPPVTDTDKLNVCVNNLRQIDGAKQQWALENKKSAGTFVTPNDLTPYLKTMPTCPAGGVYTLGLVSSPPQCSVPGHMLPR